MGFLTSYRKRKKKDRELRILILGLDNAGKSTTLCRILDEDPDLIEPTFGFLIRSKAYDQHLINFWDIGGQCSLRPFWQNYFEKTDGIIWVVDGSDVERFEEHVRELNNVLQDFRLRDTSVLIFINKQDLYSESQAIRHERIFLKLAPKIPVKTLSCSAYTGKGISEGLRWIVGDIQSKSRSM